MKVILISKMLNLGNIGDVVNVKSGFARNFLIPQEKAISHSIANENFFKEKKKQFELEDKNKEKKAIELKSLLDDKEIIIIENASDDGKLYGSITTKTISSKINEITKSNSISKSDINLENTIKEIGIYSIFVNLHSEISANLKLIISRSESEVELLKNPPKEKENQEESQEKNKSPKKSEEEKNPTLKNSQTEDESQ